jgi:hypothetical protein
MDRFYGQRVFRQRTEMDFRKCVLRIGSPRVEQILMPGIQQGNRRLARRPPVGESSNVIVPW